MKIFEIGVGEYWQCRTLQYKNTNVECWLFEPNPISFKEIQENLSEFNNFKVFNCALGGKNETINFFLAKGSSFVEGVRSPEIIHNSKSEDQLQKVQVEMKNIKEFDTGDIDLLLLDVEGSEFEIIESLVSRPKDIVVEMYSFGVKYKNPYFDQIMEWMGKNNYSIVNQYEDFHFRLNV
jgi:FkbM family methyltransferase